MSFYQILIATLIWLLLTLIVYYRCSFKSIKKTYEMWFTKKYWTDYNVVEFLSWFTKALIIVPGLIFKIQLWWLYFLTLFTSLTLIWASNKKLLPTLIGFNTLWVWISCMVLIQHLM
jgi:hypothetical protein